MEERTARPLALTVLYSSSVKCGDKRYAISRVSYDPQHDTYTCYDYHNDMIAHLLGGEIDELIEKRSLSLGDNIVIKMNHKKGK